MRELSEKELREVSGGKITPIKENGGGNTPNGEANGVPTFNENPAGHRPPGQND
jgi:bacteriocin-like protein